MSKRPRHRLHTLAVGPQPQALPIMERMPSTCSAAEKRGQSLVEADEFLDPVAPDHEYSVAKNVPVRLAYATIGSIGKREVRGLEKAPR